MLTADFPSLPALVALLLAAAGALLLLARGLRDRWAAWGPRTRVRASVLLLSLAALLLPALAAANPRWVEVRAGQALHLALVVDVSDSVQRGPGGWPAVKAMVVAQLAQTQQALDSLPAAEALDVTASLVTFAQGADAQPAGDLVGLQQAVARLQPAPAAPASDLAAGLVRAGQAIEESGGQGVVLLVSDGHATAGDALAAARRLGAGGVPVYAWPVAGGGPSTAIAAAHVAPLVEAGATFPARLILANGGQPGDSQEASQVAIRVNPGLPADRRFGSVAPVTQTVALAAQQRASLRMPLQFVGAGMQLVEMALQGQEGAQQVRRFFVQVRQPPRILALGDSRWAAAMPQDVAEVIAGDPASLQGAVDLVGYDAVVIDGLPATSLQPTILAALADAVTAGGLGLFLANGAHGGQAEDVATMLMSYNDTPLEALLPVSTRPRPMLKEPPPLRIVILIDTSGSMGDSYKMGMAKAIARHLIEVQLRPVDRLDLLTFTTAARHLVVDSPMTPANKAAALAAVESLQAGGGTVIDPALSQIAGQRLGECGLIIISDLEFDVARARPECKAAIFAVDANPGMASPLAAYAEPFYVGPDFSPANVTLSIYNPEPRDKFFEPGDYQALSAEHWGAPAGRLVIPALPLTGDAISYIVEDAELVAVRPRLTDPVLAYKRSGAGNVGAFTTGFPAAWLADAGAREAVSGWLQRVLPFVAQNRYRIALTETGDRLSVRVELAGEEGPLPRVDRMGLVAELGGGLAVNSNLRPDPDAAGTFVGEVTLPADRGGELGFLVISEQGAEALPQPQRVPFAMPPAQQADGALTEEDHSFGTDRRLLARLAAESGGALLEHAPLRIGMGPRSQERTLPLWPGLLAAGLACLVVAVALPRWLS